MAEVKRTIFVALAKINKIVLPSVARKDINNLSKLDKLLVAYRYWVTTNSYKDL